MSEMTQAEQAVANLTHAQEALQLQIMMLGNLGAWAEDEARFLAEKGISVSLIRLMDQITDTATKAQDSAKSYGMKLEELRAIFTGSFSR